MPTTDIDFDGTGVKENNAQPVDNGAKVDVAGEVTNLNGSDIDDITSKSNEPKDGNEPINKEETSLTGELEVGDNIEVDGVTYTVAENGDLVNKEGTVFKEAKDVKEWLKSVEIENPEDNTDITIASIQEALGVTITDEQGNTVEFTNDANGVKSYVDSVINLKSNELQEAAINRLYADNPLLKQFQDYVQLNGTPRGFGEIPDRSGIELEKDNEAQLVAVIRMAAQEFGNKSLNENYIKYLRDSGGLYDEAKAQLKNLVDKDVQYRKDIERQAKEQREEEAKSVAKYWNDINDIITGRVIDGYKIPESFTKEVDGKKIVVTPDDFFNYLSKPVAGDNGQRMTAYQNDLSKLTDKEYMNREILGAWLLFTGGTYKDLIDMAVKEDKVRQLRVKSKEQRSNKTVKIIKNPASKSSINDIIL